MSVVWWRDIFSADLIISIIHVSKHNSYKKKLFSKNCIYRLDQVTSLFIPTNTIWIFFSQIQLNTFIIALSSLTIFFRANDKLVVLHAITSMDVFSGWVLLEMDTAFAQTNLVFISKEKFSFQGANDHVIFSGNKYPMTLIWVLTWRNLPSNQKLFFSLWSSFWFTAR